MQYRVLTYALLTLLSAGCGLRPESPLPLITGDMTLLSGEWQNDFADLERLLVKRPLNYQECAAKSGTILKSTQWQNFIHYNCQDPAFSGSEYALMLPPDQEIALWSWSLEPKDQTYHPDALLNRVLVDVLSEYPLPIAEQNSLIELFALTGAQKYYQKPDIPYLIPELQRSWRSSKPKISLSGALQKHFHVRRTEQGLEIRKTSLWEEEPTLTLRFPDGYTLEVGSLRNPDAVKQEQYYGGFYQTTTTQLINEQLKQHLGTGIELELSLEKSLYNQTGEYLGEEKEIYLTLHFDKIAYADFGFEPSLCFQYTCFDPQTPIQHYKHRYYQYQNFPEREYQRHLLYNPNLQVMLSWEGLYGGGKCSWEHLGALHFRGSTQSFCSSTTLKQQMLQGKEKLHFPQELTFFGEKYQLQDLEMLIDYDLDARNDFGFTKRYDKPFANAEEAEQFISQEIQEKMLIYNTYLLSFADAPQIKLQYSNPRFSENPQALYFSQAEFQLNQSGELMSLPQTRKLYCDLRLEDRTETICGKRKREQPKTLEWMMIFEQEKEKRIDRSSAKNSREREMIFNASLLPLFRLQKTNIPHYYFIFPAEWVRFTNGGHGCKPVIYVYDHRKRANQLTISLPTGSRFTKLIPEFTSGTTWDFTSDEASHITVGNQTFPYLYYSTWRSRYENNTQGRTVAYEDLPAFFHAKLDAMHFNQTEKADFLDYWLPEFQSGFVYTISFKINEDFEPYAQLTFQHQPEKIFRVFMEAHQHPLSKYVSFNRRYPNAGNHQLLKVFERGTSFDVLERGGKLEKIK